MPIGVLTNCAAVLFGGLLGTGLGKILPQNLKDNLPTLFGYCSIAIGINSIIKASGMTAVVLAILVGFTIGHSLHLEHWTSKFSISSSKPCTLATSISTWSFTSRQWHCSVAAVSAGTAH